MSVLIKLMLPTTASGKYELNGRSRATRSCYLFLVPLMSASAVRIAIYLYFIRLYDPPHTGMKRQMRSSSSFAADNAFRENLNSSGSARFGFKSASLWASEEGI